MNRKYIKPHTLQDEAMPCVMLATSLNSIHSDKGIDFGGTDDDGSRDADVKESSFWDDSFNEE